MPTKVTKVDGIPTSARTRQPLLKESEAVLAEVRAGGTLIVEGDQAEKVIRQVRERLGDEGAKLRTKAVPDKPGAFYVEKRTNSTKK